MSKFPNMIKNESFDKIWRYQFPHLLFLNIRKVDCGPDTYPYDDKSRGFNMSEARKQWFTNMNTKLITAVISTITPSMTCPDPERIRSILGESRGWENLILRKELFVVICEYITYVIEFPEWCQKYLVQRDTLWNKFLQDTCSLMTAKEITAMDLDNMKGLLAKLTLILHGKEIVFTRENSIPRIRVLDNVQRLTPQSWFE